MIVMKRSILGVMVAVASLITVMTGQYALVLAGLMGIYLFWDLGRTIRLFSQYDEGVRRRAVRRNAVIFDWRSVAYVGLAIGVTAAGLSIWYVTLLTIIHVGWGLVDLLRAWVKYRKAMAEMTEYFEALNKGATNGVAHRFD